MSILVLQKILMGKRELIALPNLSSWRRDCLRFVIVVFPDHTHLLFLVLQAFFQNRLI